MSTHPRPPQSARRREPLDAALAELGPAPRAEAVARITLGRRDLLLRVHARRLAQQDLEDCFSQAALELLVRARGGSHFASPRHVENSLEQKFLSRIADRRRALSGRSAIESALALAASTDDPEGEASRIPDRHAGPEELLDRRVELSLIREVAHDLTADQRLLLAVHCVMGAPRDDFCRRYGWSAEKFRKVGQRARRRLAGLLEDYATGERCDSLRPDLLAEAVRLSAPVQRSYSQAQPMSDRAKRVRRHVANCSSCRRLLERARSGRSDIRVPIAAVRSDQDQNSPMTTPTPHRRVPRGTESRPRGSSSVPVAVHGGGTVDLADVCPAVPAPPGASKPEAAS